MVAGSRPLNPSYGGTPLNTWYAIDGTICTKRGAGPIMCAHVSAFSRVFTEPGAVRYRTKPCTPCTKKADEPNGCSMGVRSLAPSLEIDLIPQSHVRNRLLRLMSPDDFASLAPHLEHVDLPRSFQIAPANQPITHVYFHDRGIASIVAVSPEGQRAEVGLVGRDGLVPTASILKSGTSPHDIFVQVAGDGHRIEADVFQEALASSANLMSMCLRFVNTLATQSAYTALSNAVHHVDERLARWILMSHDRTDGPQIALTHEFLAIMLAVRRPSVTTALHVLEGNKFIYAERGLITVRDRQGLESFASDAYGIPEKEYERLIGSMHE